MYKDNVNNNCNPKQISNDELFQQAFALSAIGMALLSIEGNWIKINPALCDIFGYSEQELLNTSLQALTHPDDLLKDQEQIQKLIDDDISYIKVEKRYLHKHGHYIWCKLTSSVKRLENGAVDFYISNIENITTHAQTLDIPVEQGKLSKQLERMLKIFRYSREGLFFIDVLANGQFNIKETNPAFRTMLGIMDKQIGLPFSKSRKSDDNCIKFIISQCSQVVHLKKVVDCEIPLNDQFAFIRLIPALDKNGQVAHIIGMLDEIHNQRNYENLLYKREQEFRLHVESSSDIITRYTCDLHCSYANSAYLKLTGLSMSEVLGTPLEYNTPFPLNVVQSLKKFLQQALKTGIPNETEVEWKNSQHELKCLYIRIVPEFEKNGGIASVISIARDMSDHKNAEKKLLEEKLKLSEAQRIGRVGSWELNNTSGILYFSAELIRIFEIEPGRSTSTYERFLEKVHPDDREIVEKEYKKSIANNTICSIDHRLRLDNGCIKYVFLHCETVYGADKQILMRGTLQDITDRKLNEIALIKSEQKVRKKLDSVLSPNSDFKELELSDIIDIEKIQKLINEFCKISEVPIGIIDINGKVLVKGNWQDICTKFHKSNSESRKLCTESNAELSQSIPAGKFKQYHCKNHMMKIATPIIIGNKHVGNIFLAQFLYSNEIINKHTFIKQAHRFGYNEQEYMDAFNKIPRISPEKIKYIMSFLDSLAKIISNLSYSNLKLANTLEEKKQMEIELKKKQTDFEEAQRIGKAGCWELNWITHELDWSNEVYRTFEIDPEKHNPSYKDLFVVIHPDDCILVKHTFLESVKNKTAFDIEHRLLFTDGRIKYVSQHAITNYNNENKPMHSIGTIRDITQSKESELELLKAKEKAVESDRLKSAFLATMHHELRTPLNHILGFSQLIKWDNENTCKYIDTIIESANHLFEMLEDIFRLAMAEQSEVIIRNNIFVLSNQLEDNKQSLIKILETSGKDNNIELVFNFDKKLLLSTVSTDRSKITQVLYNLFKNAVKFTEKGRIEFGIMSETKGILTYYVKDTGIGIPKEKHQIIFDFFRQADDSTIRKYEGIGIGLAISKKIVEVLHGSLKVISEPNVGSTFYFSIPIQIIHENNHSNN